jgi:hypothetical protein
MSLRWCRACIACVFLLATSLLAQDAVLHREAILRDRPALTGTATATLPLGTTLTLIDAAATAGFYHVRTQDGQEGWVAASRIHLEESDAVSVVMINGGDFSPDWDKPAPRGAAFTGAEGTCPAAGDPDADVATDIRKNRIDVPSAYHAVSFAALAGLRYPVAPKTRDKWSAGQLADIEPFEGIAVTVTGYLVAIKNQAGGSGEGTNCHFTQSPDVDWHMALVEKPGDGEKESVVVETTPRLRKVHPKWTIARLQPWLNTDKAVRISGWTLLDPEHRNHLGHFRSTLWEVHPITKIELMQGDQWIDLDKLK